jgi:hypothetical protein
MVLNFYGKVEYVSASGFEAKADSFSTAQIMATLNLSQGIDRFESHEQFRALNQRYYGSIGKVT